MSRNEGIPFRSKEILEQSLRSVAWIEVYDGRGKYYAASGVCVDQSGVILTAGHLFKGVESLRATQIYMDGRRLVPRCKVELSQDIDLAVIRLEDVQNLPVSQISSRNLPDGKASPVVVVGNRVHDRNLTQVVMPGVAAPSEVLGIIDGDYPAMTASQLYDYAFGSNSDNARGTQPGYSGGPMFTPEGMLVGLAKAKSIGMSLAKGKSWELGVRGVAVRSTAILKEMNS
jgi:S1-C subfamily serine protease